MKKKTAAILSSCAAIAVCSSIIAGSTLAMFSSEAPVNVAVTTGKISVSAKIGAPVVYTAQGGEALDGLDLNELEYAGEYTGVDGTADYYYVEAADSDKATVTGNEVILNNIAAGDKVKFEITVENHSTLDVKYRTKLSLGEGSSEGLMRELNFSIVKEDSTKVDLSALRSYKSAWTELSAPTDPEKGNSITYTAEISLPLGVTEYGGRTCKILYAVEAVQTNEVTESNGESDKIGDYSTIEQKPEIINAINVGAKNSNDTLAELCGGEGIVYFDDLLCLADDGALEITLHGAEDWMESVNNPIDVIFAVLNLIGPAVVENKDNIYSIAIIDNDKQVVDEVTVDILKYYEGYTDEELAEVMSGWLADTLGKLVTSKDDAVENVVKYGVDVVITDSSAEKVSQVYRMKYELPGLADMLGINA